MEGAVFCSYWNKRLLRIRIRFPGTLRFCKNYPLWFRECLIHCHGIPYSIASQHKKCGNGLVFIEVTGFTVFLVILRQLTLKRWKGLFYDSVVGPAGWQ